MQLSKNDFKHLEKLFKYEIFANEELYPPQLHKSVASRFIENNWAREIEVKEGIFSIKCHVLSDWGRYVYCSNCKDETDI